jgi:DNA-binding XRE family transcriptional regulator
MKKLRTLRINAGLDIKTAAMLLGIKPDYLYRIENEKRKPSYLLKVKISMLYGCDINDI